MAIAYETGSIARLADSERTAEEKAAILNQRINDHDLISDYFCFAVITISTCAVFPFDHFFTDITVFLKFGVRIP